jgi:hypothetical protein
MQQTQRSKEKAMSTEQQGEGHGPFFFGADSGNHGHFTVQMLWSTPPTEADSQEIHQWLRSLTVPEHNLPLRSPTTESGLQAATGELARTERGGGIERGGEINIDARHAIIHQPETKTRRAMCGNCGARYDITDDPIENHHRAMRHKLTCGKGDVDLYSDPQRQELLSEFENQPMQKLFRERAAAELAAGADPNRLKLTGVSIFTPAPAQTAPRAIAGTADPELYPGSVEELIEACTAPRRWWQFWRWFE